MKVSTGFSISQGRPGYPGPPLSRRSPESYPTSLYEPFDWIWKM
jgi:hypothetical protein